MERDQEGGRENEEDGQESHMGIERQPSVRFDGCEKEEDGQESHTGFERQPSVRFDGCEKEEDGQETDMGFERQPSVRFDGSGPEILDASWDTAPMGPPTPCVYGSSERSGTSTSASDKPLIWGKEKILKLADGGSSIGKLMKRLNNVEESLGQIFEKRQKNFEMKIRGRLSVASHLELGGGRLYIANIVYSGTFEAIIGVVTLLNLMMVIYDTDLAAADAQTPLWLKFADLCVMAMFSFELAMRIYVERCQVFGDGWNLLDMLVVSSGAVQFVLDQTKADTSVIGPLRTLRCLRIVRIVKAFVLVNQLKELRRMAQGIAACFKVLLWALLMVFVFMTMWATVAVELLNPIMHTVMEKRANDDVPPWHDCQRCHEAFSSVMSANLTLFQTIIGSDSWGKVAIPVIEEYPWAAVIFVGALFTIQIGMLNLVIAVLVDAAAESREHDVAARSLEAEQKERLEKKSLEKIFKQVDADDSGALSLDELVKGAEKVTEFQQKLRVMDIQGEDLHQLFYMLDEDESGEIDPDEFIETLYRMKCGDNKTAATFVKHYVVHLKKKQGELIDLFAEMNSEVSRIRHEIGLIKRDSKQRNAERHNRLSELSSDLHGISIEARLALRTEPERSSGTPRLEVQSQNGTPRASRLRRADSAPLSAARSSRLRRADSAPIASANMQWSKKEPPSTPTSALARVPSIKLTRSPSGGFLSSHMPEDMAETKLTASPNSKSKAAITPAQAGSDSIPQAQPPLRRNPLRRHSYHTGLKHCSHYALDVQRPDEFQDSDDEISDRGSDSCSGHSDSTGWRSTVWERPTPGMHNEKETGHNQANSFSGQWHRMPKSYTARQRLRDPIGEIDGLIRKAIEQTLDPREIANMTSQDAMVSASLIKGKCQDVLREGPGECQPEQTNLRHASVVTLGQAPKASHQA